MNHPPTTARALCAHCLRPARTCLCRWITPTPNRVPLRVLQHPLERGHAKGSLALLRLSLSNCTVETGEVFGAEERLHGQPPGTWLLYPGDLLAAPGSDPPGSHPSLGTVQQLVLLDGSWRKTRKLLHLNPWLQQLPRFALPTPPPSRYLIRKAQQADQRSTLEAACLALGALEQRPAHYAPLLQAFSNWVQQHATLRPS